MRDPLIGATVLMPDGCEARVLDIEHDYDDGTTLLRLTGEWSEALAQADTFAVRRWPVVAPTTGKEKS